MVKKIFLWAALFFATYCIWVGWLAPKEWSGIQDTNQTNLVKAEKFLYNDTVANNIILGSSLSGLIIADSLPNTANLAFGGLGAYDGFCLLMQKPRAPKLILVEMNLVFRKQAVSFTSALLSPLTYYPRKYIGAMRADKKPLVVMGKLTLDGIYDLKDKIRGTKPAPIKAAAPIVKELSKKMVDDIYKSFFSVPNEKETTEAFATMKKYVAAMEERGSRVVFYEMPIDNQLEELPLPVYIRKMFSKNFPASKYTYIARPRWQYCETFDGLHLSSEQAIVYTEYLKERMPK